MSGLVITRKRQEKVLIEFCDPNTGEVLQTATATLVEIQSGNRARILFEAPYNVRFIRKELRDRADNVCRQWTDEQRQAHPNVNMEPEDNVMDDDDTEEYHAPQKEGLS